MIMKPLPTKAKQKGHYGDDAYIEAALEATGKWIEDRIGQVQRYAATQSNRDGVHPKLARIYRVLAPKPYKRPTHDLFCTCRKCEPSIYTYHKRMKQLI